MHSSSGELQNNIGLQHCRVESLAQGVQYVSGRKRPVGEMNGKSGNLNSCTAQLYPSGCLVPSSELICILDADQASNFQLCSLKRWHICHVLRYADFEERTAK